jgi:hypothetical protein
LVVNLPLCTYFFFQFLQTANRLLHQLPSMERHYQVEGVKGLLQVFCDVVAMLKNQEDTRAMLPSGLAKNVQVNVVCVLEMV